MAYQKLQARRALAVITSDTIDIPNPAATAATGTAAAPTGAQLVGTGTNFLTTVKVGDIIYAGTIVATVDAVVSDTVLTTSTAITVGLTYTIYSQTDNPSNGCVLFAGAAGDIDLITVDGDTVLFKGIVAGQFLPVQVKRVKATNTTATDIVALW
tara:strand:- start:2355 stop:2819 length:465 start_codon:yes stop_codon:yes gene_type:complete